MYKIGLILLFVVILSGCSVFRPTLTKDAGVARNIEKFDLIQQLVKQNVTSENFHIQKAQVEIITEGAREDFLGSVKFIRPDTFLISLRSKSGIEAARIFLTRDTILINDRINRQLLYGKPGMLGIRYGISSDVLPVFFGDFSNESSILDKEVKCMEGKVAINSSLKGAKVLYLIDCEKSKILSATREGSTGSSNTELNFEEFVRIHSVVFPALIKIKYAEMLINIKIEKIELPWIGDIEFIPGKNFELKELL